MKMVDPRITLSPQFVLSFTNIPDDGSFDCPNCKTHIDPQDESDKTYTLVESAVDKHGDLESITIQCRCRAVIRVIVPDAPKKGKR